MPLLPVNRATMNNNLTRFGVSIEKNLLQKFDKKIRKEGYKNRSEAIRDLIREDIIVDKNRNSNEEIIGTLTMIYDHHTGNLNDKLLNLQHDHTKEILVTTHIHIDHHNCLEVLILKGNSNNLQNLTNSIKSLKGIKNVKLVITSADIK